MSHTPHELIEEFPEAADKIHELKTSNARPRPKLADEYHELNRQIHRIRDGRRAGERRAPDRATQEAHGAEG
ncbi:MAG: hypothetical protein R3C04_11650 [Hyphomonas sp.]